MDWYVGVLKKYAVFDGRARRMEFWMFFLVNCVIGLVLGRVDSILGFTNPTTGQGFISGLYSLGVLLPSIGVNIRRLHDVGRSGWFMFINLIPIIGWIWYLVVMATEGQPGTNKYGPNPKETLTIDVPSQPVA